MTQYRNVQARSQGMACLIHVGETEATPSGGFFRRTAERTLAFIS